MPDSSDNPSLASRIFPAGGEAGRLCREKDWSRTLLGRLEDWPASLRTVTSLILASPQPMLLLWGKQLIQLYNDGFSAVLGQRHPAALGLRTCEGWPDLWQFSLPYYQRVLDAGESFTCDEQALLIERNGRQEEAFFTLAYSPVRDDQGEVAGVLVCAQETTAARSAHEETDLERRRLRVALEVLPVGVWVADVGGEILYAHPATQRIWGGQTPLLDDPTRYQETYRGWWPDGRALGEGEWGLARAVQQGEVSGPEEIEIACFDGTRKLIHNYGLPIRDRRGRIAGAVAVAQDVTNAKRAEQALRLSEARFRALVNAGSNLLFQVSADWSVLLAQHGTGFLPPTDCPNDRWMEEYFFPDERARIRVAIEQAIAAKSSVEFEHQVKRRDGSLGWALARAVPMFDRAGEITEWFGAVNDITARKQAEQALRESEEKYRSLFQSLDQGFAILQVLRDSHGQAVDYRFLEINDSFVRHTGLADALGRTIRDYVPDLDPFWPQTYGRVAQTGQPESFIQRSKLLGRWFEVYAFRVGAAERDHVAVLFADITERREAEAAQTEAARRKDEFLAMLGHELRNPLAAIHNTLWLLHRRIEEPIARNYLEIIQRQSGLLRGLVDDLLDVSRITRGLVEIRHEPVDLGGLCRRALEGVQGLMGSLHHRVFLDIPATPVMVSGDRLRLEQVLSNLLTNAAKYTDPGGRIELALGEVDGWAELQVRDNGIGMAPEVLAHVFDLFVQAERSLDRAQGGLGIGLTVVRQLIELHGGQVSAESAGPGQGAQFTVRLPVVDASAQARPEPQPERASRARRNVLVVDDSVEIATTLGQLLEQAGHRVSLAHDGESALLYARRLRPEVVLLDIGLPGLSGYEVATRLRDDTATRDAVVVALTGYGQAADKARALEAGFDAHFVKPVDLDALEAFVARARRG